MRHHVGVRLGLVHQAGVFQALDHDLARLEAVNALKIERLGKLGRLRNPFKERLVVLQRNLAFDIEHADLRQIVPLADLEIVEVVRRRDLHRAGALLRIGVVVADDRNAPADQRQDRVLADQVLELFVIGMHRDRDVAQHGLRPRRRDDDELVGALDRIFDVPEMTAHLDLLHLEIGDRGQKLRVPVDQPLVLVDQAVVIERDEHLQHGARQPFVHGEALARPVARRAEPLELVDDGAAALGLPGPDPLQEFRPAHLAPRRLLALHELPLDHHLGGDAGVVGAGLP